SCPASINAPPTPHFYTLSLHDALPIFSLFCFWILNNGINGRLVKRREKRLQIRRHTNEAKETIDYLLSLFYLYCVHCFCAISSEDRKSTRLNSSHVSLSYAVFCLKQKL